MSRPSVTDKQIGGLLLGWQALGSTVNSTTSFVDLLTTSFNLADPCTALIQSWLFLSATLLATATSQILVDGSVVQVNDVSLSLGSAGFVGNLLPAALAAGSHTIKVQWKATAASRIRPTTANESAILIVQRVS